MVTLFSPVGTADPITQLGDGPMLHIIRHRKPDKVVLYLSPKMAEYQRADCRYTKAILLLSQFCGIPEPEVELVESTFADVYRFDCYIEEFEPLLRRFADSDEALLVNASSGTAGMAQALVALGSFGRLNLELLQVVTPKKAINARNDRENPDAYDLDVLWEMDCEIERDAPCRLVSVQTPNFSERLLRENVITLCGNYEYEAAFHLARQMESASDASKRMIEAAAARLNLDGSLPARVFGGTDLSYKANDLLLEYLYVMEVRLAQGHCAEFMRSLSPALTELMKRKLRPYLSDEKYILPVGKNPFGKKMSDRYNVSAIQADVKLETTLRRYHYDTAPFITNAAFAALVDAYCEDGQAVAGLQRLRYAEERSRNSLAHSLRASSRAMIEKECGMSLDDVVKTLFDLHGSANPGLYDRVNETIIASF